jgi:peroxiredoxin
MIRRALAVGLAALLAVVIPAAWAQQAPANQTSTLKAGDTAPDFSLADQNGNTVRLSDFRGKQNVVLAFFVPLLSDFKREVAARYGVLNEDRGFANRATFVIDKSGRIQSIEVGRTAIEVTGALGSCRSVK